MSPENDPTMKIEQEIDAALNLLSASQPPLAMTSRIHQRLETTMERSGQARRGWLFWVPATGVVIATLLLLVFSQVHWNREKQPHVIETAKIATSSALPGRTLAQPVVAMQNRREQNKFRSNVHRNFRRHDQTQPRHAVNFLSYPLTRQEKLLVKFVQTAKPADLQILNPEYQSKVDAQQEAEFVAYQKSGSNSNKQRAADTNQSIQE